MLFIMFVYALNEDNKRYVVMLCHASEVQIHHSLEDGRVTVAHKDGTTYTADVVEHPIYIGPYYRALDKANAYAEEKAHIQPYAHNVLMKPKPEKKPG